MTGPVKEYDAGVDLQEKLGDLGVMTAPGDMSMGMDLNGKPTKVDDPKIEEIATASQSYDPGSGFWGPSMAAAAGLGSAYVGKKLEPISPELMWKLFSKVADPTGANTKYPVDPKYVAERMRSEVRRDGVAAKKVNREAAKRIGAESSKFIANNPAAVEKVAENWAKAAKDFGNKHPIVRSVGRGIKSTIKATPGLGKAATKAAGSTMVRSGGMKAAAMGARLGLRLAAFAIPGPGWLIGGGILLASWFFDSGMRGMVWSLMGLGAPSIDDRPERAPGTPFRDLVAAGQPATTTQYLPVTNDGSRDVVVRSRDAELQVLNNSFFGIDPDKTWPQQPEIGVTPNLAEVIEYANGLKDQGETLGNEIANLLRQYAADEPVVEKFHTAGQKSIQSLGTVGAEVIIPMVQAFSEIAEAVNQVYQEARNQNSEARIAINKTGSGLIPPQFTSVDEGSLKSMTGVAQTAETRIDKAITTANTAASSWVQASGFAGGPGATTDGSWLPTNKTPQQQNTPGGGAPGGSGSPGGGTLFPGGTGGSGTRYTGEPSTPDTNSSGGGNAEAIRRILDSAATTPPGGAAQTPGVGKMNPAAANDMMNNPMGMGGMNSPLGQLGQQLGQLGNQIGNQLGNLGNQLGQQQRGPASSLNDLARQLKDDKPKSTAGGGGKSSPLMDKKEPENVKDKGSKIEQSVKDKLKPETKPTAGKPAAAGPQAPAPKGPGGGGGGADSGGEKPLFDNALDTEPKANDPEAAKTVKVDGKDVTFPDEKTANMIKSFYPQDGSPSPTMEKAAGDNGFKVGAAGQDFGEVVSSAELRPGDAIIGNDHKGFYLGDQRVLTADGKVMPLSEVASFSGPNQGIFRPEMIDPGAAPATPAADTPAADNAAATPGDGPTATPGSEDSGAGAGPEATKPDGDPAKPGDAGKPDGDAAKPPAAEGGPSAPSPHQFDVPEPGSTGTNDTPVSGEVGTDPASNPDTPAEAPTAAAESGTAADPAKGDQNAAEGGAGKPETPVTPPAADGPSEGEQAATERLIGGPAGGPSTPTTGTDEGTDPDPIAPGGIPTGD